MTASATPNTRNAYVRTILVFEIKLKMRTQLTVFYVFDVLIIYLNLKPNDNYDAT